MMSELGIVMPKMRIMTSELVVMSALDRNIRAMSKMHRSVVTAALTQLLRHSLASGMASPGIALHPLHVPPVSVSVGQTPNFKEASLLEDEKE